MAGIRYQLVNPESWQTKLTAGGLRGQTTLILKELIAAHPAGLTSAEITDLVKDTMVTRQPVERVVGFYLSIWKKAGHIRPSSVAVTPGAEESALQATIERSPGPSAQQKEAVSFIPVSQDSPEEEDEDGDNEDEDNGEEEEEDEAELQETLSKTEKMRDAVLAIVAKVPGADTDEIVSTLNDHWRTGTTRKQVNDCLLKMAKSDEIRRQEQGGFYLPSLV